MVYGRRRVGKTYLIREFFNNSFSFYATGVPGEKMKDQLAAFHASLLQYDAVDAAPPRDWMEAFGRLRSLLEQPTVKRDSWGGKRIVFLDELPWMATAKSDFKMALDLFWNGWASSQADLLLIVCGSAASWIIDNILMDTGGLYNRITRSIHLMPFSLQECSRFLEAGGNIVTPANVMACYMTFGGVPYYLNMINHRFSIAQNVDKLLFQENGVLHHEYDMLFRSLFKNPEKHYSVLRKMSEKKSGVSRDELLKDKKTPDGETLTKTLRELEQCGFIRKYRDYTMTSKGALFQITDPFVLFALRFLNSRKLSSWTDYLKTPSYYAWAGNAFEIVCLNHVREIKRALGIEGISSTEYAWRSKKSSPGAQIDLLIDRKDDIINLCEMKYSDEEFVIDAAYEKELLHKEAVFRAESKSKKAIHITMVTSAGIKRNEHWQLAVNNISGEDLLSKT